MIVLKKKNEDSNSTSVDDSSDLDSDNSDDNDLKSKKEEEEENQDRIGADCASHAEKPGPRAAHGGITRARGFQCRCRHAATPPAALAGG